MVDGTLDRDAGYTQACDRHRRRADGRRGPREKRSELQHERPEVDPEDGPPGAGGQGRRDRSAGTRQERVRLGGACAQPRRDLAWLQTLPFPQHEREALPLGDPLERVLQVGERVLPLVVCPRRKRIHVDRRVDDRATPAERSSLPAADVLGDRRQPGRLAFGDGSALERAVRLQEGRLEGVLGVAP